MEFKYINLLAYLCIGCGVKQLSAKPNHRWLWDCPDGMNTIAMLIQPDADMAAVRQRHRRKDMQLQMRIPVDPDGDSFLKD